MTLTARHMQLSNAPLDSTALDRHGRGYPRPQLRRAPWFSLNGGWDFAFDREAIWRHPREVTWSSRIEVPFSPETAASGVGDTSFLKACWYRLALELPPLADGERLLLHFGAVDYEATVWIDGRCLGAHEGGYTPFSFDITDCAGGAPVELVVRADDDPQDLAKPRGKQDWQLEPHSIWYPRTTGIWQTVWMEVVPAHVHRQRCAGRRTSSGGRSGSNAGCRARCATGCACASLLTTGDLLIADDTYSVINRRSASPHRALRPRHRRLPQRAAVEPESPTLIDVELELWADRGELHRQGLELHGAALRRRCRATVRAERPALPPAAGAGSGLLARDAA